MNRHLNRIFFEHTSDAITITNEEGRILYVNSAFERASGYEKDEIKGESIDVLRADKNFVDIYWRNRNALKEDGVFRKVFVNKKKNGNFFYMDTKVIPYTSDLPTHEKRYVSIGADITNIIEQTQRIGLLEFELQKSNHTLETLLYKSSHDLRAPIATIQGLLNLAKMDIKDDGLLNYLDMIVQSTTRLDSLLIDIRKLSTIHANKFSVEEINFEELLKGILTDLGKFMPMNEIAINVDVKVRRKHYYSRYLLKRILRNLIDNACRYRLERPSKNHTVFITIEEVGNALQFFIIDNGRGIREEAQERLFEMFYKAEAISNRNGLGLHIAKTAIDKLKGQIELSSRYNQGTKVKVSLPQ